MKVNDYIAANAIATPGGGILVADRVDTPVRIYRALTRRYGRSRTRDRGEIGYWDITDSTSALAWRVSSSADSIRCPVSITNSTIHRSVTCDQYHDRG